MARGYSETSALFSITVVFMLVGIHHHCTNTGMSAQDGLRYIPIELSLFPAPALI